MLAVKILLEHQLSVPRDQHGMDLRRVVRVHRHVEQLLDKALHCGAIDVLGIERRRGPAVIELRWCAIRIVSGILATRIEIAVVVVAQEIVAAATAREHESDDVVLRVIATDAHLAFLTATLADELERGAIHRESLDALLRAEIEFGVAQYRAQ